MPYLDKPLLNLFRLALFLSLVTAIATILSSCTGGNLPTTSQVGSSDPMVDAIVGTVDSFFDEVDSTLGTTKLAATGSCIHSFQCATTNSVMNRVFTDCAYDLDTGLPASATLNGQSVVAFSSEAACLAYRDGTATAVGTTITKTWPQFSILDSLRSETFVVTSSAALAASYQSSGWVVTLPEITRTSANYSYKIKSPTSSSLAFSGARKTFNRQLSSSSLSVIDASDASNQVSYNVAIGFLQWKSATCCLPSFGAIEITNNATSEKVTYTFDGAVCNQATRSGADGVETTVTLQAGCE